MSLLSRLLRPWIRKRDFPDKWETILQRNFPLYRNLPPDDMRELRRHIMIFLAEKHFEGCAGQEITDNIRVTIAAQACVLLLHRETDYYPGLFSILVYPNTFVVEHRERDAAGVVTESIEERIGEAWAHGSVVLAWDSVSADAMSSRGGHNVVFHEFAHQLDYEDGGRADGSVPMPRRSMYESWARTFEREFRKLREEAARGMPTLLDQYGAKDPAEFFAVTTEAFFTQPAALKDAHSDLYQQLRLYYQQDPAQWRK